MFRSGRVVLEYVWEHPAEEEENVRGGDEAKDLVRSEMTYQVAFDADMIRFGSNGRQVEGERSGEVDWTILNAGRIISDPERRCAVRITRRESDPNALGRFQIFHPRALGMNVKPPYRLYEDDVVGLIGRADRKAVAVTRDEVEGAPVWRIDYEVTEIPAGSSVTNFESTVWISPDYGNGIVRATERYVSKLGVEDLEVRSKLMQYPSDGIWYPSETVTTATYDGSLRYRDTVTVKKAEFNAPVDPDVFTLKGLNLKVGRLIVDESEGPPRGLRWDGEKAVGISAEEVRAQEAVAAAMIPEPEPIRISLSGFLKFCGAAMLAAGAVAFGWYGLQRRRAG